MHPKTDRWYWLFKRDNTLGQGGALRQGRIGKSRKLMIHGGGQNGTFLTMLKRDFFPSKCKPKKNPQEQFGGGRTSFYADFISSQALALESEHTATTTIW